MAFTSFNLSRFKSTFKRAMAALGYTTDSAIRARVLQEAQGSAVWARFAPSVAGYPALPRVAGNIQIDELAALTALGGGTTSDPVLSYVAPDFKVGNTLPALTSFFPSFFERTSLGGGNFVAKDGTGGVGGQLADDWGYAIQLHQGDTTAWATDSFAATLADTGDYTGCVIAAINSNPGRWKLSATTRQMFSWENTSLTEDMFADFSGSGTPANYMIGGVLVQEGSASVMTPNGEVGISLSGGVDYTPVFMTDADGTIIRQNTRAMLKPYWCYSDAATAGGVSVAEAATAWANEEARLVTLYNAALTGGYKLDVVRNGQEYQPAVRGNNTITAWTANRAITVVGEYVKNGGNAYKCITTGTTASSGGPTGTGADITDGTVHWKYMKTTTVLWNLDPEVEAWLATLDAYANDATGNGAYIDQITGARVESETALRTAVETASPTTLYIYYSSLDIKEGYWDSSSLHTIARSRRSGTQWGIHHGKSYPITALPSPEFYRGYFADWLSPGHASNQYGSLPELVLNAAAACIAQGTPLMYPFISGGWRADDTPPSYLSYDDQWMGFCKFMYTAGCLGADYGWYGSAWPTSGRTFDSSANTALRHAIIVGHVHATFSHLENYLRSGSLLPGDYDARSLGRSSHWNNKDVFDRTTGLTYPSYEYIHNDTSQLYSKVIARKLDASNDWLICAWKCQDAGDDTTLSVTIAGHVLSVNARRGGTLYHMDNSGTLTMLDPDSMDPSRSIATILAGL